MAKGGDAVVEMSVIKALGVDENVGGRMFAEWLPNVCRMFAECLQNVCQMLAECFPMF